MGQDILAISVVVEEEDRQNTITAVDSNSFNINININTNNCTIDSTSENVDISTPELLN